MKLAEFQAKQLFRGMGIPVPRGSTAATPEEASRVAAELGGDVVLKAQIHSGGRGKAGGIRFASSPEEAKRLAGELLHSELKGEKVSRILVEEKQDIRQEHYLSFMLDRNTRKTMLIFCAAGGMEIEEVARSTPEKIIKIAVDPVLGLQDFHLNALGRGVDFDRERLRSLKALARKLYGLYIKYDCLLVEINPLIYLDSGEIAALDAKLEIDDNARYRQPELTAMVDGACEDPLEKFGRDAGFVVIKLKGTVSVISNGAGIAISTLDLLKKHGASAANILDLSGGATAEKVMRAVDVVTRDKDVSAVLFNIFGGITRCDEIARGVTQVLKNIPPHVSVVCRLNGTNRDEGIRILKDAGLGAAFDLEEAVRQVVRIQRKKAET